MVEKAWSFNSTTTIGNTSFIYSTTIIPTRPVVYDYMDFELPILVVVTVLFCLSAFILCTKARRNWNQRMRERNNQMLRSQCSNQPSRSSGVTVGAFRNPGFSSSTSNLDVTGISSNTEQPAYVIPTPMIMPPTYVDLPPSYEDVIKECNNAETTQNMPYNYLENSFAHRQTDLPAVHGVPSRVETYPQAPSSRTSNSVSQDSSRENTTTVSL